MYVGTLKGEQMVCARSSIGKLKKNMLLQKKIQESAITLNPSDVLQINTRYLICKTKAFVKRGKIIINEDMKALIENKINRYIDANEVSV